MVADLTFSECAVVCVFMVILFLLTAYSLEFGSAMLAFITSKLALASTTRHPPELWPAPLRRVLSLRSRRWIIGDKDRAPVPDVWYTNYDSRAVRRRRLVGYIINALKFRDKFGFLGKNPHNAGPIKPNLEVWDWLIDNFDIETSKPDAMSWLFMRKRPYNKAAKNEEARIDLAATFEGYKGRWQDES